MNDKSTTNNKNNLNLRTVKAKQFIELLITFYPVVLIFFVLLDFSTFSIFNLEWGYLRTIISNINLSSFHFIFIFMMIPTIFIVFSFFIIKVSHECSDKFIDKNLKKFNTFISKLLKSRFNNITKEYIVLIIKVIYSLAFIVIYLMTFMSIIIIIEVFSDFFNSIQSFVLSYLVVVVILLLLDYITITAYKVFDFANESLKFRILYVMTFLILMFSIVFIIINIPDFTSYIIFFKLAFIFHGLSIAFVGAFTEIDKGLALNNTTKPNKVNLKRLTIMLAIVFVLIDSAININFWKSSIDTSKKYGFNDGTFNLLFNHGLLLNSKYQEVHLSIPSEFEDELDWHYHYLKECKKFNVGNNSKYLEFGSNLRLYFLNGTHIENNKNKMFVFLVEEEKSSNLNESNYRLITMSSYITNSIQLDSN